MEDTYDVVVCGTGLVECILSGLLSQDGMILIISINSILYFHSFFSQLF